MENENQKRTAKSLPKIVSPIDIKVPLGKNQMGKLMANAAKPLAHSFLEEN